MKLLLCSFILFSTSLYSQNKAGLKNDLAKSLENQSILLKKVVKPNFKELNSFSISPSVSYASPFCRMEVKSMLKTGVWIKIHAGDYDSYYEKAKRINAQRD